MLHGSNCSLRRFATTLALAIIVCLPISAHADDASDKSILGILSGMLHALSGIIAALPSQSFVPPNYSGAGSTPVSTQTFAQGQRIDNLANVTISNATVNGITGLTASNIPDLSGTYLPLSGGTLNAGLVMANATSTNFFSTNASTTNATSTSLFATLGHFTTGIIDSLTAAAATITNLIVTTITGTNATFTNATTTNATSTNLYASNLNLGSPLTVANGGTGGADASTARTNLGLSYASTENILNNTNIAAWGDSLTAVTAGSYTNVYLNILAELDNKNIYNGGVSGETSTQIKTRMLAATSKYSWPTIIWAGRNDFSSPSTVEANIASMVAALASVGNTNYIILSILNGPGEPSGSASYNQIISINNFLASTYGSHYLDVRTYLIQSGLSVAGIATSTQDQIDYGNDVPATDFRSDSIVHLNVAGYTVVANYVYQNISLLQNT
ncbi:MAG: SGNH/GDSL hydrolase family protein, partial [Pseudolabrys sp.]|nr:SGNH/GDSL hydrolase family protein [Pseudolabrys sp.]